MSKALPQFKYKGKAKGFLCLNSHITILDNNTAVIENCRKIIECNEILVKVMTNSFEIEVWGNNLTLNNFCTESIEVRGKIESIKLMERVSKERDK